MRRERGGLIRKLRGSPWSAIEELVNASLLQCVDETYWMHDLIHDLALLVSNGEFASAYSLLTNDQMKKVRHLTITEDDYSKIPRLCNIEKLLNIYTTDYERNSDEKFDYSILDDIFKQLKSIRVLVLRSSKITDIPNCISELSHLRYLDVCRTDVISLPDSLCRLYNLQMIAAPYYTRGLEMIKLPRDIVNISSLRYVRATLSTCKGVGKLTSLQELSSIYVCEGDNIRELGDMQIFCGKLRINGLRNVDKLKDDVDALMEKQTHMDKLMLLFDKHFEGPENDEELKDFIFNYLTNMFKESTFSAQVLDALGCPPNLKCLTISLYNGVKPPSWMVDGKHMFSKLQTLEFEYCPNLESLPPLDEFDKLHT